MLTTARVMNVIRRSILTTAVRPFSDQSPELMEPTIPPYEEKLGESLELKKARLLYQSRKRGMLENGILLSTFAAKFLNGFDHQQAKDYDRLINLPSNDWDIFYWATGVKPTPEEFNTEVMNLFKDFIKNHDRELRIRQPDLQFPAA